MRFDFEPLVAQSDSSARTFLKCALHLCCWPDWLFILPLGLPLDLGFPFSLDFTLTLCWRCTVTCLLRCNTVLLRINDDDLVPLA